MVRTFPEAGLVFFVVHAAVLTEAPEPFSVLFVYQIRLYEFPAHEGVFESGWISEMIPKIEAADDGFCLDPPVSVSISSFISMFFINHSPFVREAFQRGGYDDWNQSFHPC